MKTVTQEVKNAFKQPTTKRKGVIVVNNQYYDIYNVEYNADCYDEGKVIGNAIASQLDFDIPYMSKFDTFQYYDCIWVGNGYEYIDYGTFTVFDEKDQDEFNKHITAFDNLIKFNKVFENTGGYPKTLYNELLNICNQAGVTLGNNTIPNGSFSVVNNQFTNGENLKTVLKQICAISGTYAIIKNNVLYLQLKNITTESINKSQHEPVDWKRRSYGINQVIIGDSQIEGEYVIKQDDADIALNGVHKLEIKDNLFAYTQAKRNALINELYNQVHGFGYIPYETKGEWLSYLEIGDTITIDGTETILLRVNAKSPNALETTMSAPAIIDSSIEYVDNTDDVNNRLKLTERTVDKQNQVITDVVSTVDEQNDKISYITQTVDEINQKISDIADVTVSGESDIGDVILSGVNASEPITLKVHPIVKNITCLYPNYHLFPATQSYPAKAGLKPSTSLTPSTSLVPAAGYPAQDIKYLATRKIRFIRTYTVEGQTLTENIDYELPDDLLYYDSTHYDEFYLNYDNQICKITKRCKYNADGTIGLLAQEEVHNYTYPLIPLGTGDYEIQLLNYDTGYLYVQLMASNIYTTQYATKVELSSAIRQTTTEITSEVSETYSTKAEANTLSSRISQTAKNITLTVNNGSTSSGITIGITKEDGTTTQTSGTIEMNGLVKFTDLSGSGTTTINGSNITTGTINGENVNVTNINADNIRAGTLTAAAINLGNGNFSVNTSGYLQSKSGTIGGWTISSNKLGGDNTYLNPNGDFGFYHNHRVIGSNGNITINSQQGKGIIICDGIINPTAGNVTMSASNSSRLRFVSTTNGIQIRTSAISVGFSDNDARNCLTGIMKTVSNTSGTNVTHYFVFTSGLLVYHSTTDPSSIFSGYTKWY